LNPVALRASLDLLTTYRNNAVHFYNAEGFGALIYSLAQAAIVNYRDLAKASFGIDIANEMPWVILPLGRDTPFDPIAYMNKELRGGRGSGAVRQFLTEVADAMAEVEAAGGDAGRLLTTFAIKLESVKKLRDADVVVGVVGKTGNPGTPGAGESGPLAIVKTLDPNVTHPLRQRGVLQEITTLHGRSFTSYTFQAVVWERNLKDKPHFCWVAREGVLTKYSRDVLTLIRAMTAAEVDDALAHYGEDQRRRAKRRKAFRRAPALGTE
jgi:hypothetical protein